MIWFFDSNREKLSNIQAKEKHRMIKFRRLAKWAVDSIQRCYISWKVKIAFSIFCSPFHREPPENSHNIRFDFHRNDNFYLPS